MRKFISVLVVTASLPLASIATPAHADGGGAFVGGLFGGLAAGTLIGIAAASPGITIRRAFTSDQGRSAI
jgi:hypothetical protein